MRVSQKLFTIKMLLLGYRIAQELCIMVHYWYYAASKSQRYQRLSSAFLSAHIEIRLIIAVLCKSVGAIVVGC